MEKTEKYKHFDHKADVLYEAYGKNLSEAIENAAQAMFDVIGEGGVKEKMEIREKTKSIDELVVATLSACLTESEIGEFIPRKFEVKKLDEKNCEISGTLYGDKKGKMKMSVKAVTFHEFQIRKEKGKVSIRVLLDI
ncbi:Protein archease [Candidatus Gugararchaeum adminiculabundum]|nr:Protein archease [Candidatus Gugararchaeum adminiculabundum]